ncbi:MAG: hypothetical protein AAFX45_11030 [Pseudomonadota bacterium]
MFNWPKFLLEVAAWLVLLVLIFFYPDEVESSSFNGLIKTAAFLGPLLIVYQIYAGRFKKK